MATIPLEIQIRAERASDVKRAIRGVTKDIASAQREANRESAKQNRERKRTTERTERDIARIQKQRVMEQQRLERMRHRERVRQLQERIRQERRETQALKRESRERVRSIRAETRAREQAIRERNRRLAKLGAAAAVGASIARSAVGRAEGFLGLTSQEQRIAEARDFTTRLSIVSGQAGFTPEQRAAAQKAILGSVEQNLRTPTQALGGLEQAQASFDDPQMYVKNAREFGRFATVLQSTERELVNAAGTVVEKFSEMSNDDIPAILAGIKESADRGVVEPQNIAGGFAPRLAQYADITGRRDSAGFREALAFFQLAGTSRQTPDEVETSVKNFLNVLAKEGGKGGKFAKLGVTDYRDEAGRVDMNKFINKLVDSPIGQAWGTDIGNKMFMEVFKNVRGQETARAIINATLEARKRGDAMSPFQALAASSSEAGMLSAQGTMADIKSRRAGQAAIVEAKNRAATVRNQDEILGAMLDIAGPKQKFEREHPLGSMGIGMVLDNIDTILLGGIFAKLTGRTKWGSAAAKLAKSPAGAAALTAGAVAGGASYMGGPFLESTLSDALGGAQSPEAVRRKHLEFLGLAEPLETQTKKLSDKTSEQTEAITRELRNIAETIERQGGPNGGYLGPYR